MNNDKFEELCVKHGVDLYGKCLIMYSLMADKALLDEGRMFNPLVSTRSVFSIISKVSNPNEQESHTAEEVKIVKDFLAFVEQKINKEEKYKQITEYFNNNANVRACYEEICATLSCKTIF